MTRYFVLWWNADDLPVWEGPYETFDLAMDSTSMRDLSRHGFVTMTQNWQEFYRSHGVRRD